MMGRILALLCLLAAPASADVLKLIAELHGGGMYGKGTSGDQKDSAFFAQSPHGTYGALVGAEILFFDGMIQHHQYTDGKRITTWTQFGVGLHNVMQTGTEKEQKAGEGGYMEFAAELWFGVGTGQQVKPPLDNAQISDKAFLAEGRFGFGTHADKHFDFGVQIPATYGWFFKNGNGAGANNVSNQYRGFAVEALLVLRLRLGLL